MRCWSVSSSCVAPARLIAPLPVLNLFAKDQPDSETRSRNSRLDSRYDNLGDTGTSARTHYSNYTLAPPSYFCVIPPLVLLQLFKTWNLDPKLSHNLRRNPQHYNSSRITAPLEPGITYTYAPNSLVIGSPFHYTQSPRHHSLNVLFTRRTHQELN